MHETKFMLFGHAKCLIYGGGNPHLPVEEDYKHFTMKDKFRRLGYPVLIWKRCHSIHIPLFHMAGIEQLSLKEEL